MCAGGAARRDWRGGRYAAQRNQFGQPIAVVRRHQAQARRNDRAHVCGREPAVSHRRHDRRAHRAAIDRTTRSSAALAALEEYAIEASIAKVAGSETLNFVLDENIQIHGGNGFVRDYPAERHYRDSRVNRIFEGTNEINRLLITGMLVRRAVKGDVAADRRGQGAQDELLGPPACRPPTTRRWLTNSGQSTRSRKSA